MTGCPRSEIPCPGRCRALQASGLVMQGDIGKLLPRFWLFRGTESGLSGGSVRAQRHERVLPRGRHV